MIKFENLKEAENGKNAEEKTNLFEKADTHRQRADIRLNIFLTLSVLPRCDENGEDYFQGALDDYKAAEIGFRNIAESMETQCFDLSEPERDPRYKLVEAMLARGNAWKENFLPGDKDKDKAFKKNKIKAEKLYLECYKEAENVRYFRYCDFTSLEQMNLDARSRSWEKGCNPRRIVIFHTSLNAVSLWYLKAVYYYALREGIEVWEYVAGRAPTLSGAGSKSFISDRLVDACGVVFLGSKEYRPGTDHIEYEISQTKAFKESGDPIQIFVLDLGNQCLTNTYRDLATVSGECEFEERLVNFLELPQKHENGIKDIYECRKSRLNRSFIE